MKAATDKKRKMPSAIRLVLLVLCGAILGVNVYLANANSLVGNKMPMPFGYGMAVVLTGSMEPEFSAGDLIVAKEAESYDVKEIVVFQESGSLIVHRIIEVDGENVITKGDANNVADDPVPVKNIKGKVLFHVPYVGNIVNFIKTPIGTICIIILAIVLLELPRRKAKERDDEEREKLLDEIRKLKENVYTGDAQSEEAVEPEDTKEEDNKE